MAVTRRRQAERPLKQDLARRGGEEIGATHDLRDALPRVIDNDRQVIGDAVVAALDDEVAGLAAAILPAMPLERILELDRRRILVNRIAQCVQPETRLRIATAGSRVDGLRAGIHDMSGSERCSAAAAGIAPAADLQFIQGCCIVFNSIGLELNASIPLESECSECPWYGIGKAGLAASLVEVIDPEEPAAALVARAQVAAGGCQQRAQVQGSGRGRREAAAGRRP